MYVISGDFAASMVSKSKSNLAINEPMVGAPVTSQYTPVRATSAQVSDQTNL